MDITDIRFLKPHIRSIRLIRVRYITSCRHSPLINDQLNLFKLMSAAKTQQQAKKTSNFFSKILIQKSPPKALRHSAQASLPCHPFFLIPTIPFGFEKPKCPK